jgi:hypothetical protein
MRRQKITRLAMGNARSRIVSSRIVTGMRQLNARNLRAGQAAPRRLQLRHRIEFMLAPELKAA